MIYQSLSQSECCCRLLSRSRVDPSLSIKGHDSLGYAIWKRHAEGLLSDADQAYQLASVHQVSFKPVQNLQEYSWCRRAITSGRDTRLLLSSYLWKQSKLRFWVRLENSWCCAYEYLCSFHPWTVSQLQSKLPVQYSEDVSTSKWVAQQPACWVRSCLVSRVC